MRPPPGGCPAARLRIRIIPEQAGTKLVTGGGIPNAESERFYC